jgi:hypothetical protein
VVPLLNKTRVRTHGWSARSKKLVTFGLLALTLVSLIAATMSAAVTPSSAAFNGSANTQPLVGATTHPIEYQIGCPASMVNDGSLDYFKAHGFTTVHLVVLDQGTYQTELNKIKSLGMKPIIDIEVPIWNAGQLSGTPISSFASYFQSLKNAGWEYVASEGGRAGDLDYLSHYFKGYVNYNCDQCGLWKDMYKHPFTVANSWESYYTAEWPYIQQGATQAASLGKQNGILAGVWEYGTDGHDYNPILTNSKTGGSPSYKSMLDWSYSNGIGFSSFHVWCGSDSQGLSRYKALGFEKIVADLQVYYPAASGWSPVGGQLASGTGPAACAQNTNSLDVFMQGTDHALWYRHYESGSGWSSWNSLGGSLTSSPAAVSRSAGKIDVFVRGTDGALWTRSTTNGATSWSGWSKIAAQLLAGTGPAAYAWGDARIGVFVTGTNKALYHMWTDSAGTHSWQSLGGTFTSSPAATAPTSGVIDVYGRGGDGALYQKEYSSNAWGSWTSLGGQLASNTGPAACSWGPGRLDVFVQGTNGALYHKGYNGAWSNWQSLGGKLTSSPAAAAASGSNRIDVFVRGTNGALWWTHWDGQTWS